MDFKLAFLQFLFSLCFPYFRYYGHHHDFISCVPFIISFVLALL